MLQVKYTAPCFDSSGYAEAARNNIVALTHAGVAVLPNPISFENRTITVDEASLPVRLMEKNKNIKPAIHFIHCTPENYRTHIDNTMYNIGYAAWETNKLPLNWAKYINALDEIWVPSTYNVKLFRESGVTIPITLIPHTFSTEAITGTPLLKKNKDFVFYSIFQWLERKNPIGLLKAYLTEFSAQEDVLLVIKTFLFNHNSTAEVDRIKETIKGVKMKLYLPSYPRILLITDLLTSDQIKGLHQSGDCYVHLHRSEGFGMPIAEAMLEGKPVITTGYGGVTDFVQDGETGLLINSAEVPVYGMPWPIYSGDMLWAEPDVLDARRAMRAVFTKQQEAIELGKRGQDYIKKTLSFEKVGKLMRDRLEQI